LHNWHIFTTSLKGKDPRIAHACEILEKLLLDTVVIYYKPHQYSETIRIEIAKSIADDDIMMSILLTALKRYLFNNSLIKEPFLLFLADRQAKQQITSACRLYKTRLYWLQSYRTDETMSIEDHF
jgi:hypothetical protein